MKAFNEIYAPPFITDGMFIYAQGDYNIPALDTEDWNDNTELLQHICDILNGKANNTKIKVYYVNHEYIGITFNNINTKLRVRGYGHLMKGEKLEHEEAEELQDKFALWVVSKIDKNYI